MHAVSSVKVTERDAVWLSEWHLTDDLRAIVVLLQQEHHRQNCHLA